jgi:hypothetical protein
MINSIDLTWTEHGAYITSQGEWDFKKGSCYYWDEAGNEKIYVKGGH